MINGTEKKKLARCYNHGHNLCVCCVCEGGCARVSACMVYVSELSDFVLG